MCKCSEIKVIVRQIKSYLTFCGTGSVESDGRSGSSSEIQRPVARTLTSSTIICRDGMVNPNSVSYLCEKQLKMTFLLNSFRHFIVRRQSIWADFNQYSNSVLALV